MNTNLTKLTADDLKALLTKFTDVTETQRQAILSLYSQEDGTVNMLQILAQFLNKKKKPCAPTNSPLLPNNSQES